MKTFTNFDLPVKHLEGEGEHYVPPKARDPHEIERRRMLAKGVLLAEKQAEGIKIARGILEQMVDQDDTLFATRTLAAASLNTAWYSYAQGAQDVMRRTLQLPNYEDMDETNASEYLFDTAIDQMGEAEIIAQRLVRDGHERRRLYVVHKKPLGLKLGNTAIVLATIPHANQLAYLQDPAFRQMLARDCALGVLEDSRTLYKQMNGSNPTLAQLADQDSPLSVYWRNQANNLAYNALELAQKIKG
jgi:hypothetical protein